MAKQRDAVGEKELSTEMGSELSTYFVDPSLFLDHTEWVLDTDGIPLQINPELYNPIIIAFYGLERWNQYLLTKKTEYRDAFLRQAQWLLTHEVRIRDTGIGWLVPSPLTSISKPGESCLSAYAQGSGLSVLIRAYQLTHGEALLEKIHDVVCTFDRDILDGGILSPIGEEGVFFEEVAIYPATHSLPGCIVALFGLLDYTSVIPDRNALDLINRGLDTVHLLIDEFDAGFWTYKELQSRCLASSSLLTLQSVLLEALARHTDCVCCLRISDRWQGYLARWDSRLRYRIRSQGRICKEALWKCLRFLLFRNAQSKPLMQVCIPVTAFPVTGGIRAVLASVAQAMENRWHIEYVTRHLGPNPAGLAIHQFGTKRTTPWQFPTIWLYVLAGWHKLISLLRQGSGYQLFLPQDGVSTSAFTALAAKFIGTRVVSIDHGNLTLLKNPTYRAERLQAIKAMNWSLPRLLFAQYRYRWYWRSLTILAHFSARYTDHFLIPGIAGDGVEEVCRDLGIRQSQITRFASMVDVDRYPVLDDASKAGVRARYGVPADAIVIALICRLSPEKGLDIALESLSQACSKLSEAQLSRVRVIIAGDGPLREKIESEVSARVLNKIVSLWGETEAEDVIALLSLSDIFFYTSVRGACFSMAVLEAMAASCAVIASIQPLSNKKLLADDRGIAISTGDPDQGAQALVRLIADGDLRHRMGEAARAYVAAYHSETSFRRMLQRATYWFELDSLLSNN